jgi:hypothetical protein
MSHRVTLMTVRAPPVRSVASAIAPSAPASAFLRSVLVCGLDDAPPQAVLPVPCEFALLNEGDAAATTHIYRDPIWHAQCMHTVVIASARA